MKMPIQPIKDGRFIPNRIVEKLLEVAPIDLNNIATMDFTNEEHEQFAQLIGYSVSGFGSLSYVSDETYNTAERICETGATEDMARIETLQETLRDIRVGLKAASVAAFSIHPDDLTT